MVDISNQLSVKVQLQAWEICISMFELVLAAISRVSIWTAIEVLIPFLTGQFVDC